MTPERQSVLRETYLNGLLHDTLPFWIGNSVDHEHGGFMTCLGRDGTVIDTDKSVWQQGRFTWLLGELFNELQPRPEWLALAKHGADFLDRCCCDQTDGRMWFHVTRDGRPIRKRRYAFSESFAAIAYGELAKATGDESYAEKARSAFDRFIDHNESPPTDLSKFTDTRPMRSLGFPMILIATAQELRDSIGLPSADELIDRGIAMIVDLHVKPEHECVMETVGIDGQIENHFDGRTLNPGHAIEAAWFILREAAHRGSSDLTDLGCRILDWMWKRGWDPEFGGMLYFTDLDGLPVQEYWSDMKFWWPHNETIIATLMAYQATGDSKYSQWHDQVHRWSFSHFPDPEHGEWFGYLDRSGRVAKSLKGNLWKGPFHLPRMQLLCGLALTDSDPK